MDPVCIGRAADHAEAGDPVAADTATVVCGSARFTVLTPQLLRMEWSPNGRFEDRASLLFPNRRLPVPPYDVSRTADGLAIRTAHLSLRYRASSGCFTADSLSVSLTVAGGEVVWRPGLSDPQNLGGTRKSLDNISGAAPLGPGLLSRSGWAVVDDSHGPLLVGGEEQWPVARAPGPAQDWYFFGYGHDYPQALEDFTRLAGRIPLPPRFVFGSWWSRYWAYSDRELQDLVGQFDEHDVPLDVLVVDMDWHLPGWSAYTWQSQYFPDPAGFLRWAHARGLQVPLNLHPGVDIEKHEARYAAFARAAGHDPDKVNNIPFDHFGPQFARAYFRQLLRPLEEDGVDFWWLDYVGHVPPTPIAGLDPLLWCNALHIADMEAGAAARAVRPLIFSRWGGLANHRYQIGFTGDTYSTWESLAFQPYFTATAGNVCFPYWSHDIGGHYLGPCPGELYARWIQWGVFNPVLRTHSTVDPAAERRIWAFPPEIFHLARQAFHLRYELIPYIYTAARQSYDAARPLCRPLYYAWPEQEEAYTNPGEYLFGSDLLVAPVVGPRETLGAGALARVWLPPGEWTDWFTGQTHRGGTGELTRSIPLHEIPVFARGGAIIPAAPKMRRSNERPLDPLILHVFPGPVGQGELYEDDGRTLGYRRGECTRTRMTHRAVDGGREIVVGPTVGAFPGMRADRQYEIRLREAWPPATVTVNDQPLPATEPGSACGWWYDVDKLCAVLRLPRQSVRHAARVVVSPRADAAGENLLRQGLRGRLDLLGRLADLLGPQTPAVICDALAVREMLRSDPAQARIRAEAIVNDWCRLVELALRAPRDADQSEQVAREVFGGACDLRVEVAEAGRSALTARAELRAVPPFGALPAMTGQIRLTVPPGWRTTASAGPDGGAIEQEVQLRPDQPGVLSAALEPRAKPCSALVEAEFVLRAAGRELRTTLSRTLLPSIDQWWILGPFDNPVEQGLDKAFPPETKIDLAATYAGKDGQTIAWRRATRPWHPGDDATAEFAVDFHKLYGVEHSAAASYALSYLHAPREMDAFLALGSDDGVVVWLNGQEAHRKLVWRPYASRQDRVPVHLRSGCNTLLLKIIQGGGGWGFGVHVETVDGRPLTEVQARLAE